jgi:hypothetical protein
LPGLAERRGEIQEVVDERGTGTFYVRRAQKIVETGSLLLS